MFLEEPTTGLDPQSRSDLWDHIRALRSELQTTVFLTTHYLDEADALCDRVLVIDDGKIIASTDGAAVSSFATDTILIVRRQLTLMLRQPAWLIIGLIQPILYLVLFGPLLTKVASGGLPGFPAGNSYSFFVPDC